MGTYSIVIEGHGINHNNPPHPLDADQLARQFVEAMRKAGHTEVKGYFVYGPKLATTMLEPTMSRGLGSKRLEPLVPMCDHKEWVGDKHGRYARDCGKEADFANYNGQELVSVRCAPHAPVDDPAWTLIPAPVVKA